MPAASKSQQRLMGMVHAYQQGKLNTKSINADLLGKIRKIAGGIKKKSAKDFAETKHKGLPELKESNMTFKEWLIETRHSQYAQQKRSRAASITPPAKLLPVVQKTYHAIKQNKGEVDFNEFKERLASIGNGLSPEGVEQLLRIPMVAELVAELPFASQEHDFKRDAGGRKDPWAHVKVSREQRREGRRPKARNYFS